MVNIFDTTNQLASELQEIDEFSVLKEAIEGVKNNAESTALFKEMDKVQNAIVIAQSKGEDLSQELQDEYKNLNEKVQQDPQILKLLQAEQGLYGTIEEVQKIITQPINDLYKGLRN